MILNLDVCCGKCDSENVKYIDFDPFSQLPIFQCEDCKVKGDLHDFPYVVLED